MYNLVFNYLYIPVKPLEYVDIFSSQKEKTCVLLTWEYYCTALLLVDGSEG